MSQRLLGMLVAFVFAVATPPVANAGTQCGCGQVASPCGDCYGGSVVSPCCAGGENFANCESHNSKRCIFSAGGEFPRLFLGLAQTQYFQRTSTARETTDQKDELREQETWQWQKSCAVTCKQRGRAVQVTYRCSACILPPLCRCCP